MLEIGHDIKLDCYGNLGQEGTTSPAKTTDDRDTPKYRGGRGWGKGWGRVGAHNFLRNNPQAVLRRKSTLKADNRNRIVVFKEYQLKTTGSALTVNFKINA